MPSPELQPADTNVSPPNTQNVIPFTPPPSNSVQLTPPTGAPGAVSTNTVQLGPPTDGSGSVSTNTVQLTPPLPPEQVTRNLQDVISNPLNIPLPARQPAQAPPDPAPGNVPIYKPSDTPLSVDGTPARASAASEYKPADTALNADGSVQSAGSTYKPTDTPLNTDGSVQPAATPDPVQQEAQLAGQRSAQFNHDPKAVMNGLAGDNSIPLEQVVKAVQYAQQKDEAKDDWAKIQDDYINGAKTVGSWISGVFHTLTDPVKPLLQLGTTIDEAREAVAPLGEGQNPMEDKLPTSSSGVSAIGAPGTPLASDIVRPPEAPLPEQLQLEQQRAQRELVAGGQSGYAGNKDMLETALNTVLGISANNPISAWWRTMGGPRAPGAIDPKDQINMLLQKNPVAIQTAQDVNTLDPDQLIAQAAVQRFQSNYQAQMQSGYVSPSGENLLDLWSGGKAHTPEELANGGYAIRPTKVDDIAGTANLALSIPEFAVLDSVLGAVGAKSALEVAAGRGLQALSVVPEAATRAVSLPLDIGESVSNLGSDVLKSDPRLTGLAVEHGVRALLNSVGMDLPIHGELADWMIAQPVGKILTPPVTWTLDKMGLGFGWGSKLINAVSEPVADWLDTAGSDMVNHTNLLSTRSPIGNLIGKTAQNVSRGVADTAPAAALVDPHDPEQAGELAGWGILGHQIPKTPIDVSDVARNAVADQLFQRDPSVMRGKYVAPDMSYGFRPDLDKISLQTINSVDPATQQPAFSDAQKQTFANTRAAMNGVAEIHIVPPSVFSNEINTMFKNNVIQNPDVNARGIAVDPNPSGTQARVLVRSDHFDDAFEHEISHAVASRMTPEEHNAVYDAYTRTTNPDTFTQRYTGGAVNNLSDLPTQAGVDNGTEQYLPGKLNGLSQEDVKRELVTEAVSRLFKGATVDSFTRNPTLARNAQFALGGILNRLGFEPTTDLSKSIVGVQPSMPAALVLDSVIRDVMQRNGKLAPPDIDTARATKSTPKPTSSGPAPGAQGKPFIPSTQWQDIPDHLVMPNGGEFNAPMGGKAQVRWDKPPGQESVFDRNTGKYQPAAGQTQGASQEGVGGRDAKSQPANEPQPNFVMKEGVGSAAPIGGGTEARTQSPSEHGMDEATIRAVMKTLKSDRQTAVNFLNQVRLRGSITPVHQGSPVQGTQAPTAPVQGAPSTGQPPGSSTNTSVQTAPEPQPEQPERPIETTESTAPVIHELRQSENISPGEAQSRVHGLEPRPALSTHGKVVRGYFGYPGDRTFDQNSLRGIGAFPHSAKPGSMIPGYSAALSTEGARLRNVRQGQEFFGEDGVRYRYDDHIPDSSHVSPRYIDIFMPSHEADPGVSAEQIARNQAIMIGSNGQRGSIVGGEPIPALSGTAGAQSGRAETPVNVSNQPAGASGTSGEGISPLGSAKSPITARDISASEAAARASMEQGKRSDAAYEDAVQQAIIQDIGARHAASLAPGDDRVQYHPDSGYTYGTHMVTDGSDPFHTWMINKLEPDTRQHQLDVIQQIQPAIQGKNDVYMNYGSAPQVEPGMPTNTQRKAAQEQSAAPARAKGEAEIQSAGKEIVPSNIGFSLGTKGNPSTLMVSGVSADKVAGNFQKITQALGPKSPYAPVPLGDNGAASVDLAGYLHNVSAGFRGTGEGPITPIKGQEADVPATPSNFTPYMLSRAKSDVMNLAVNGSGSMLSTSAKASKSAAAFQLARENEGFAEPPFTNPLAKQLSLEHGPEFIKDLNSGFESLRADLISKVHHAGDEAAQKIHPGHSDVVKALQEGLPPKAVVKAGFLPAEAKSELSTADRIKKNEHMILGLEKKQKDLDLDDPADSDTWDQHQARIHELEDQNDQLKSGAQEESPSTKGTSFIRSTPEDFIDARNKSSRRGFLSPLEPSDLSEHKLYTNKDGTVGVGIDPHGDVQNVFNNGGAKGEAAHAVVHAIEKGGKTLDAYDGFLPDYYRQFGFQETGRMKFNPEFSHGWDTEKHGNPDVVFMGWKGYPDGGSSAAIERASNRANWIQNERSANYEQDWETAKANSRAEAINPGGEGDNRGTGAQQGQEVDYAGDRAGIGAGEGSRGAVEHPPHGPGNQGSIGKAYYLPGEKAPQSVREQYEGPERKAFIANMQQKAQDWLDANEPHPLSAAAEKIPEGAKMSVEQFADHLEKQHKPLDISKPKVRQTMADAATHDVMTEIAKNGNGVGWYETTPKAALKYVNDHLDHSILETPENTFMYKVAQAISSQNQDVFDNAETGYHAYKYWQDHGELPTAKKDLVGGGIQVKSILGNFKLVNDLQKRLGTDGVKDLFDQTMTVKEMKKLGLTINGESPDYSMQGSLALGPKIGAFYSALNGKLGNLVMDLWHSRAMNRITGDMFQFSNTAFKKQAEMVRNQINSGEINDEHVPVSDARAAKMLSEIDKVAATPDDKLTRRAAIKMAPTLMDWAKERRVYYSKTPNPDTGKGTFGEKTPVNMNAKNMDYGLHKTQDHPRNIPERGYFRDIAARVQSNLKEEGIDMTIADIQAQEWYSIQRLFQKAGALGPSSDANDYLDSAWALVKQQKGQRGRPAPKSVPIKITRPKAMAIH